MITTGDYFFFALDSNHSATAFRSELGDEGLMRLKSFWERLKKSETTDAQYKKAVELFAKNPHPTGTTLQWVCQERAKYLDINLSRFDLTPR